MSDVSFQTQRGRWWLLNDGIPIEEKTLVGDDQGFDEKCHQNLTLAPGLGSLLYFRAQTLLGRWVFSYGTQTSQSPSRVIVSVLK